MTVTPLSNHAGDASKSSVLWTAAAAAAVWLVLVTGVATTGVFARNTGGVPLPVGAAALIPVAAFLLAYRVSARVRATVYGLDLVTLAALQLWRVVGLLFVALMVADQLHPIFAWPAGLGDVLIGLSAFFVLTALRRRPDFARTRRYLLWNVLGILDFIVAIGSAVAVGALLPGAVPDVGLMQTLPFLLIPGFLVPMFAIVHLAAILKVRREYRQT